MFVVSFGTLRTSGTSVQLTVMDVQGRQVLAHEKYGKSNVLDLSSFPEGMYLMNLKGKEINATFRVLR
ncbi:MAG TPA: T9SS type A sorting domain-containing protein [Catalimonadaceae bacterium]|nr:T9SS type A sorting domain-containing protein [Catalimonadaceae bacterium]